MDDELIAAVGSEVMTWPGVREEARGSAWGGVVIYWVGKRQIGHIHDDGVADLQFPKAVHDRLIAEGRAEPHRGGFGAVVSYPLRSSEDVPGAIELFRLSYDRVVARKKTTLEPRSASRNLPIDEAKVETGASAA